MLAADWSKQLFDVAQMRTIRYPLKEGNIEDATAKAVSEAIKAPIDALSQGDSPVFTSIKGYPTNPDPTAASTMKGVMADAAVLQGKIRAVRAIAKSSRMAAAKALAVETVNAHMAPSDAISVMRLVKNCVDDKQDWAWLADFTKKLPSTIANIEEVRETYAFALANSGNVTEAIAKLEELLALSGPTPERLGLLGGRYKRLFASAKEEDKAEFLKSAIDAYQRGMELDLNQYYCSSNLPRLYRVRNRKGDEDRAIAVSNLVVAACERAKKLGVADEWLRPTLLGAAFDAGDADKAEELAEEVADEGASRWKLDTMIADLETSVRLVKDPSHRERLGSILADLKRINAG